MKSSNYKYAARLNSFKSSAAGKEGTGTGIGGLLKCAAKVEGLNSADLNYPDHLAGTEPAQLAQQLADCGLSLNGMAMRYYSNPDFKSGALANPDPAVRKEAVNLTKDGIDALAKMDGTLMTLWLGEDGFDYSFQTDYARMWDQLLESLAEVADHNPQVQIALEYKPNEPRTFALLPDAATTLLALRELGRDNTGVTLDFAHMLYADEMPAQALALVLRHSQLLGIHLNDGFGKRDDGLMVGSVHLIQTLELLFGLLTSGYDRAIYMDTFPDNAGIDPVREASANIVACERLLTLAQKLRDDDYLKQAMANNDAVTAMTIVQRNLLSTASDTG